MPFIISIRSINSTRSTAQVNVNYFALHVDVEYKCPDKSFLLYPEAFYCDVLNFVMIILLFLFTQESFCSG
jgi:hypothetical protein